MDIEEHRRSEQEKEFHKAVSRAQPLKDRKILLLHERELLAKGELHNITHKGASAIWLEALSSAHQPGKTIVYRPMGDTEAVYLVQHKELPDTQPYQAIIEGANGRDYANKYLTGQKWTDTNPSTIVEFVAPIHLIETLKTVSYTHLTLPTTPYV
eukprot:TRINITY_DN4368_c0_g1_i1.p1 TRINITY_DN4368_c0_g1~~TRINITY_DN4368_c0_g1_i1.p1  ORF type:complete len:155 (+),score=20.74 TRINITY_DN4368_c0_g1_i1:45-509(+)